jgi:DNA replication protein DnaC
VRGAAAQARTDAACPLGVCDGSGWILGPEDVARPCECRQRTISRARLRGVASVIPAKYRGVSFERPPVTQMDRRVVSVVSDYCADVTGQLDAGRGLWLHGDPGTGKTTLAMLVSKTALEHGRSVAIYSMPKLLARIRRTYDGGVGEQTYDQLFERLSTVDLLHIDDLGAESRTEWVLEQLYALINERYESERALIVTSNHDYESLEEQVGTRVVSRLSDMCEALPLFGEDRRLRVAPPPEEPPSASGGGLGPLEH